MSQSLRSTSARVIIGLVVAGMLAVTGWYVYEAMRPGRVNLIRPSYAFDVGDRKQVAGHADNVFVGSVVEVVGVDDKGPNTIFRVSVDESVKGTVQGIVLVRQLGGKIGKDVWLVENDEPLAVGRTYILASSQSLQQEGAQVLLAGRLSHQAVNTPADRQNALAEWRDAVGNQRQPDTAPS